EDRRDIVTHHSLADDKRLRLRILLVDDNETNRLVAQGVLTKLGYGTADIAGNGLEALAALEKTPCDLVLMDVQMPEMDGFEATRAIRDPASPVRNHAVPIIAMTAHAMKEDRERCLEAGMDDYVSKPLNRRELAAAIERRLFRTAEKPLESVEQARSGGTCESKVFNRVEMMERLDNDEELIAMLLKSFVEIFPSNFTELQQAVEDKNAEMVHLLGHTIKGSSANVSADAMRNVALEIEKSGKAGDITKAAGFFEDLKKEFERFEICLKNQVNS
ncbi:MAG: response regulator, partial [Deltaproteobacteria bacterium]|nr:response regulator [Deltaproteobacteria bacterium]